MSAIRIPPTVVVSVDAELGWGHHDYANPPRERVEYARTGWRRLCALFECFDVPATWAVVGHLFLDECDGVHADHPAPPGWFDRERTAWAERRDLRFGSALVERVADSPVGHEVGCHGFSHARFDDPSTDRELAAAELAASEAAAGRSFDSFVFPRNGIGHRDVLAEAGYACYRGLSPGDVDGVGGTTRKLARNVAGSAPPIVDPEVDAFGLVNVPASLYLFGFNDVPRALAESLGDDPIVRRVRSGLDALAAEGGVLHLWLHPNNVRGESQARRLRGVLGAVADARDDGDVTVATMREVAARVRERAPVGVPVTA